MSRGKGLAIVGACLLAWVQGAGAQSAPEQERPFPYELRSGRELALVGVGAALHWPLVWDVQDPAVDADYLRTDDVSWIDRYATTQSSEAWRNRSDQTQVLAIGAAALTVLHAPLSARGSYRSNGWTLLVMAVETVALTSGVTSSLKELTGRTRPYAYNDALTLEEKRAIAGDEWDVKESFPSGHTSSAFAAAVFTAKVFSDVHQPEPAVEYAVWGGAILVAGVTGFARMKGGKHFFTDVLTGAAIGTAVGYWVPHSHQTAEVGGRGEGGGSGGLRPAVIPRPTGQLGIGWTLPLGSP